MLRNLLKKQFSAIVIVFHIVDRIHVDWFHLRQVEFAHVEDEVYHLCVRESHQLEYPFEYLEASGVLPYAVRKIIDVPIGALFQNAYLSSVLCRGQVRFLESLLAEFEDRDFGSEIQV